MKCDMKCFDCKFEDCINDDLTVEEMKTSAIIDKQINQSEKPLSEDYRTRWAQLNSRRNKANKKRHYQQNKDKYKVQHQSYYQKHKEELNRKRREQYYSNREYELARQRESNSHKRERQAG